jgi:hypothetical protein
MKMIEVLFVRLLVRAPQCGMQAMEGNFFNVLGPEVVTIERIEGRCIPFGVPHDSERSVSARNSVAV